MKTKLLTSFLILVLLTVGIMGIFSVSAMEHDNQRSCPFSVMSGVDCSKIDNSLFMSFYHLSGVEYFTQFIVSTDFNLLIFFTVMVFTLFFILIRPPRKSLFIKIFSQKIHIAKIKSQDRKQFLRWLSLNNSKYFDALNRVHCIF
jgi:hypothetical protein